MEENKTELSVNTEVLEKMAEIAAKEVEGVAGLSKKAVDITGIIKSKSAFKGVKVENINGAIDIKEKIQNMTGTAVTKVNVCVADIEIEEQESENEQKAE